MLVVQVRNGNAAHVAQQLTVTTAQVTHPKAQINVANDREQQHKGQQFVLARGCWIVKSRIGTRWQNRPAGGAAREAWVVGCGVVRPLAVGVIALRGLNGSLSKGGLLRQWWLRIVLNRRWSLEHASCGRQTACEGSIRRPSVRDGVVAIRIRSRTVAVLRPTIGIALCLRVVSQDIESARYVGAGRICCRAETILLSQRAIWVLVGVHIVGRT